MRLNNLNAVIDLEISLLLDETIGLVGLLIRSPEPIWNPKMPLNQTTPPLIVNHLNDATAYKVVYSKDRSCVFISNSAMNIPTGTLTIIFQNYNFDLLSGIFRYEPGANPEDQKFIEIDLTNYL